jgi:hypothetical protein
VAPLVVCGRFQFAQPVLESGGVWYCGGCGRRIRKAARRLMEDERKSGKGAWYFTSVAACVICGWTRYEKERRWDKKPRNPAKRREYIETACGGHFL